MLLTKVFRGPPLPVLSELRDYLHYNTVPPGLIAKIDLLDGSMPGGVPLVTLILRHHTDDMPDAPKKGCAVHYVLAQSAGTMHQELERAQNELHELNRPHSNMHIVGEDVLALHDEKGLLGGFFWVAITMAPGK